MKAVHACVTMNNFALHTTDLAFCSASSTCHAVSSKFLQYVFLFCSKSMFIFKLDKVLQQGCVNATEEWQYQFRQKTCMC